MLTLFLTVSKCSHCAVLVSLLLQSLVQGWIPNTDILQREEKTTADQSCSSHVRASVTSNKGEHWLIINVNFLDTVIVIWFYQCLNVEKQEREILNKNSNKLRYDFLKWLKHCFLVSFGCRLPPRCLGEQRRATTGVWAHYEVLHQESLAVHVWSSSLFSTQETKHRFGDVRNCWMCPPTLSVIS